MKAREFVCSNAPHCMELVVVDGSMCPDCNAHWEAAYEAECEAYWATLPSTN